MNEIDWVVMDMRGWFHCLRCGQDSHGLPLPMLATDVGKAALEYSEEHRFCKPAQEARP